MLLRRRATKWRAYGFDWKYDVRDAMSRKSYVIKVVAMCTDGVCSVRKLWWDAGSYDSRKGGCDDTNDRGSE